MNNKILWFIPAGAVTLGIFLLSTFLSISASSAEGSDKVSHCFAYCVLIISFLIGFKKSGIFTARWSVYLLLIVAIYGFSLELAQHIFFSHRHFEWADAGANVLGASIGFIIFKLFDRG